MKLIFSIALLVVGQISFGQIGYLDTAYFNEYWQPVEKYKDAMYYRESFFVVDDTTYVVQDFYLETNTIQMIGYYKGDVEQGNQNGTFTFFYKDGRVKAVHEYKDGMFHGKAERFYENGRLSSVECYNMGEECDTMTFFYQNGQIKEIKVVNPEYSNTKSSEYFKRYKLLSSWSVDGTEQVVNGTGKLIEFKSNGKTLIEVDYKDGYPHGEWIRYVTGKKNKIASTMNFKDGVFISGEIYEQGKKEIFASIFREPRYPGGREALEEAIARQTGFCEHQYEGEVMVMINVYEDGTAEFEQILSGNPTFCQEDEIRRFIQSMPKWSTAIEKGEYTEASHIITITY